MRCDWASRDSMGVVLAAMMPENRLVMEVCLATALRVGDVLALPTDKLHQRMTIRESKTGKNRRVYFPQDLYVRMVGNCGKVWVFPGRVDPLHHRTRQAVWRDVHRVSAFFQRSGAVPRGANLGTHTARKMAAVDEMRRTGGNLDAVGKLLNHSGKDSNVTALYALADAMTANKLAGGVRHGKCR